MNKPLQDTVSTQPKRAYRQPRLRPLGSVKKLTLKLGSNVDGMGGFS